MRGDGRRVSGNGIRRREAEVAAPTRKEEGRWRRGRRGAWLGLGFERGGMTGFVEWQW